MKLRADGRDSMRIRADGCDCMTPHADGCDYLKLGGWTRLHDSTCGRTRLREDVCYECDCMKLLADG
jgi:hypothetical protein